MLENHSKDPIIFDIFQKQCCWFVSSQWTVISCHSSGHTPLIAHPLRNTIQTGYQSPAAMCHCCLCHNNIGDMKTLPCMPACSFHERPLCCVSVIFVQRERSHLQPCIIYTLTGGRSWVQVSPEWRPTQLYPFQHADLGFGCGRRVTGVSALASLLHLCSLWVLTSRPE